MKRILILGFLIKFLAIFLTLHNDQIYIWEIPAHFLGNVSLIGSYYGPLSFLIFGFLSPVYYLSLQIGYWILKVPYLFVDLYILYILLKLTPRNLHQKIMVFWWLNPVVIFSTYMLGQLDILLSLSVVLSVYLASKSKIASTVSIGAGVAIKTMSLPLILPTVLTIEKNFKSRIMLLLIGALAAFVPGLLLFLITKIDITNAYFPKGIIFYPKISTTPDSIWEYTSLIIGVLGFVFIQIKLFTKNYSSKYLQNTLYASLAFVLVALPIYSLHRYVIITPLLVLVAVKNKKIITLSIILVMLVLGYVYQWRLQWGLIVHIFPIVKDYPAIREFLNPYLKYENLAFAFRVIVDISLMYLAFVAFSETGKRSKREQTN